MLPVPKSQETLPNSSEYSITSNFEKLYELSIIIILCH